MPPAALMRAITAARSLNFPINPQQITPAKIAPPKPPIPIPQVLAIPPPPVLETPKPILETPKPVLAHNRHLRWPRLNLGGAPPPEPYRPQLWQIKLAVCQYFNITETDIHSQRRSIGVVRPRQVCDFLATSLTVHTTQKIGKVYGGRDHTTVLHSIKTIRNKRLTDAKLDADIRKLEEALARP